MAIRPSDLQTSLIYQTQAPPINQRAEEAPRTAQAAAQAQFVSQTEERNERIAEAGDAKGNKIGVKEREAGGQGGKQGARREHRPGDPFEEVVDEAAGLSDGTAHLIDYSA